VSARILGSWLLIGVLTLGLFEIGLRGYDWYINETPSNKAIRQQLRKIYSDDRDKPYVFGHHPNVVVELKRGKYKFTYISNSDGLRETQDYVDLDRSVIFVGDSIIEGASVENHETIDSVFEKLTGIVSLNFGLGSANTIHEFHWLTNKYKEAYNTRLIVLGFCLNDFEQNTFLRFFDVERGTWQVFRSVSLDEVAVTSRQTNGSVDSLIDRVKPYARKSWAVYSIYGMVRKLIFGPVDFWRASVITNSQRIITEAYLVKMNQFAKRIRAKFLVIIFPQESQFGLEYRDGGRMQDVLIEILMGHRIPYLDLFPLLQQAYHAQPEVDWYYDDTHPYKPGHRLIGEFLANEIMRIFPNLGPQEKSYGLT